MIKRLIITLLFYVLVVCLTAGVLNFPLCVQEQNQWCWAGTSQAIMSYYGLEISQTEIAAYGSQGVNTWNYLWGNDETRNGISLILDHFANIQSMPCPWPISYDELMTEINEMRPFVTRIGWTTGGGHFLDCYGYSNNTIYLMDPWPGNGFTLDDYNWYVNGSPDFLWTDTLVMTTSPQPLAKFHAVQTTGPAPLSVQFLDDSTGNPTSWFWDFTNDGIVESTEQNPTWVYPVRGIYDVKLTIMADGQTYTTLKPSYIYAVNNPPAIVNPIPTITLQYNTSSDPINLNNVFHDNDNDSLSFVFANSQHHINADIQNGIMTLTPETNWSGSSNCMIIAYDGIANGVHQLFQVIVNPLGIDQNDNTSPISINIYPNPVHQSEKLQFKISDPSKPKVDIFNVKGQIIASPECTNLSNTQGYSAVWDCKNRKNEHCASGIYFCRIETKSGIIQKKILLIK
jgi:PKD repeat protein